MEFQKRLNLKDSAFYLKLEVLNWIIVIPHIHRQSSTIAATNHNAQSTTYRSAPFVAYCQETGTPVAPLAQINTPLPLDPT